MRSIVAAPSSTEEGDMSPGRTRYSTRSSINRARGAGASRRRTTTVSQQEDRAAHLGAGAVSGVLRDARQERADRRAEFKIEASNLWNFFQAKNIRRTLAAHRRRGDDDSRSRPATDERPRPRWQSRSRMDQDRGALSLGAGSGEGRPQGAVARAPSKYEQERDTSPWRDTTITSSPRRRSRSASCWRRPPSSPA